MREKYTFQAAQGMTGLHLALQQEVAAWFDTNKALRKHQAGLFSSVLRREMAVANAQPTQNTALAARHAAMNRYEKRHLAIGGLRETLLTLRATFPNLTVNEGPVYNDVYAQFGGVSRRIGTILRGTARFIRVEPQPGGVLNVVYVRIGDAGGRHYIRLGDDHYVRRFVVRGLNGTDAWNLTNNQPLVAPVTGDQQHQVEVRQDRMQATVNPLTRQEQVLSHTRGWGKRFLSATTTARPAFSTKGTEFRSIYGAVYIDLARVPVQNIIDLHTPEQASRELGTNALRVMTDGDGFQGGDATYLALRDVIRTREILIRPPVQPGWLAHDGGTPVIVRAVRAAKVNQNVFSVLAGFQDVDEENFAGTRTYCVLFDTANNAIAGQLALQQNGNLNTVTIIRHYGLPDPPPAGV